VFAKKMFLHHFFLWYKISLRNRSLHLYPCDKKIRWFSK